MHFHVARDTAEITFEEFDEDFAETSSHLLNKFSGMVSKYRALLLKESMVVEKLDVIGLYLD